MGTTIVSYLRPITKCGLDRGSHGGFVWLLLWGRQQPVVMPSLTTWLLTLSLPISHP